MTRRTAGPLYKNSALHTDGRQPAWTGDAFAAWGVDTSPENVGTQSSAVSAFDRGIARRIARSMTDGKITRRTFDRTLWSRWRDVWWGK